MKFHTEATNIPSMPSTTESYLEEILGYLVRIELEGQGKQERDGWGHCSLVSDMMEEDKGDELAMESEKMVDNLCKSPLSVQTETFQALNAASRVSQRNNHSDLLSLSSVQLAGHAAMSIGYSFSKRPAPSSPLENQPQLTESMRGILLSWLVDVHVKYRLSVQTFCLTVRLIDGYLQKKPVTRCRFQLLGMTAMWVAAKYQETHQVPRIKNLVQLCDSAYKPEEILEMESNLLAELGLVLVKPTCLSFFEVFNSLHPLSAKDIYLAHYLLEASLFCLEMRRYPAHLIALSAVFFIRKLRQQDNSQLLLLITRLCIPESEVRPCANDLGVIWKNIEHVEVMRSLRSKYLAKARMEVAKIRICPKVK